MKQTVDDTYPEGKEEIKLETYRTAIKDARHIFTTYRDRCPQDAWECIKKIIFNPALK